MINKHNIKSLLSIKDHYIVIYQFLNHFLLHNFQKIYGPFYLSLLKSVHKDNSSSKLFDIHMIYWIVKEKARLKNTQALLQKKDGKISKPFILKIK